MKPARTAMTGLIALAFASLVASCGGSGGSSAGGAPAGGTAAGSTTVSKGAIERFGSVVVNGVEFKVAGATLHLRDDNVDKVLQNEAEIQNNLEKGMVIIVKGKLDDTGLAGAATEIEFRDALTGKIDDKGVDFVKVMGQTIVLDDNAKLQLAGLAIGDNVRISALADDKGGLRATHIKRQDNAAEFEVKGFVSGFSGGTTMTLLLSPTATTGLSINLAGAALPAGIKNGDFVEVRSATSPANGVITATRIKLEDELKAAENENAEFEGFVANLNGSGFMIGTTQVTFSDSTVFMNGVAADLTAGMKVEVEGNIVNGALVARKIVFKDNLRISALVTAVDPSGSSLTLLGKNVTLPSKLEIRESGNAVAPAALTGRFVDLRGRLGVDGLAITATRIDVKSSDPGEAILRAPVSTASAADNTLTIAGILVNTAGAEFKGKDAPHSIIAATLFFTSIVPNETVVRVRWRPFTTTAAPARDVELEN